MHIHRVNINDFESFCFEIENLLNQSAKVNFPYCTLPDSYGRDRCNKLREFVEEDKATVFVALDENVFMGWLWCFEIERLGTIRLHISEIGVVEKYKRQGVGNELLTKAEEYAKEKNIEEIDLLVTASNTAAVLFYEKASFEPERYLMKKRVI